MPAKPSPAAKKQPLTLAQLAAYDDILTDALVDHAYYWSSIPKNRSSYHPSRGVREDEIAKILQLHIIVDPDLPLAEEKLLATDGLRKFLNALKTPKEKDDFRRHLRRYLQIYLPDCPFEVNTTNRYTIVNHEASITARRFIKRGETVKYLAGIQVIITPDEEREISVRKKDFSIVVSSRSKCASLFMGPARFANHDCGANAKLMTTSNSGMEVVATQNIDVGDEITVTYGENYFGEDNCECLCKTCEDNLVNGWAPADGQIVVKKSIEEEWLQGYSLRRRRRDDSTGNLSRTPSVAPVIRPKVPRTRTRRNLDLNLDSENISSPTPVRLTEGRKRTFDSLATPPITPAKRMKMTGAPAESIPLHLESRGSSSVNSANSEIFSSEGNADSATDITSPEKDTPEPVIHSPKPTPIRRLIGVLKQEESDVSQADILAQTMVFPAPTSEPGKALLGMPETPLDMPTPRPGRARTMESISIAALCNPIPATAQSPTATSPSSQIMASTEKSPSMPEEAVESATTEKEEIEESEESEEATEGSRRKRKYEKRTFVKQTSPPVRLRIPGDYTLTPLLLSEPEMAWINCTNCNTAFVQQNAYYTRSSCPRCERHSKLYGYVWPKTEPAGPRDKEERVLDHRTVHRFLDPYDEAKVRRRKRDEKEETEEVTPAPVETETPAKGKRKRAETPMARGGKRKGEEPAAEEATSPLRRSRRMRRMSSKMAGSEW